MKYISTRDPLGSEKISSAEAIKKGLAPDGGLYMPQSFPSLGNDDIKKLIPLSYQNRAEYILSKFLDDYDAKLLSEDCAAAYSDERFPGGAAPVEKLEDGRYTLELWHGPTCAFKDMALQIMPRLLSRALSSTGEKLRAHILVATSGDTGKAALEGYRDVDGVDITVFYPEDGVSPMQKLQMTTQQGDNVNVCAVNGNFDDAQNGVKRIFSDREYAKEAARRGSFFSSANSINWGRLAPQIVYYISAYCDLAQRGEISLGDKIDFCVPTGNFGNIFAGYIAKSMGLPVSKFICASNSNCVLTDFIENGVYDRNREFFKTMSPSMDILISSNLERLIWSLSGPVVTKECMEKLAKDGKYTVPADVLAKIKDSFCGFFASEAETAETIKKTFTEKSYLIDTHTAVAVCCLNKYRAATGDMTPAVIVSTASPYKFARDVIGALGGKAESDDPAYLLNTLESLSGTKAPAPLRATVDLPVRFKKSVDPAEMIKAVFPS